MEPSSPPVASHKPVDAAPAQPAAENPSSDTLSEEPGFWGWWGGVKAAVGPKLSQVGNVLDDVGTSVKNNVTQIVGEAKTEIDKVMDSETMRTVKSEVTQFGQKVAKGADEVLTDIKDFIFDESDSKVFGVTVGRAAHGYDIPIVLQVLLARLEDEAPKTAGLFDESKLTDMDKENLERCKSSFNRGLAVDLGALDANSVSVLFLMWFRELPEPVIGRAVDLSKLKSEVDSLVRATMLKQLLQQNVPPVNYNVLRVLMGFLKLLHANENVTGWNVTKTADLFGPFVIAGYGDATTQFIVRSMIVNYDDYFPETFVLPEEPALPSDPVVAPPTK